MIEAGMIARTVSPDPFYRNVGYIKESAGCQLARVCN